MSLICYIDLSMAPSETAQQLQLQVDFQPSAPAPKAKPDVGHSPVAELLATPDALLTRSQLRRLGLERRAVDAVFRALPVIALPGYSRPMVRVEDYVELVERNTYRDDRVRPVR
jgi:hypothetical protein